MSRDDNPKHRTTTDYATPTNNFTELFPSCVTLDPVAELKKLVTDNPGRIHLRKTKGDNYSARFSPNYDVDVEITASSSKYLFGTVSVEGDVVEEFEEYVNLQVLLEDIAEYVDNYDNPDAGDEDD